MTESTQTANPLLGTWHLVRWEVSYSDGRASRFPYGKAATGMIQYTTDGYMSACIARGERGKLSTDNARAAPEAEKIAAFESYFQYAGRYEMRAQNNSPQVVHSVTHALNPYFIGTQQIRDVSFSADGALTLSAAEPEPNTGLVRRHHLVWRRSP